jgi:hypothetical protein
MSGYALPTRIGVGVAALVGFGCRDPTLAAPRPSLAAASAHANPLNTLSAVMTFAAQHADSARVVCRAEGGGDLEATPNYPVTGGAATIAVLGLLPSTRYQCTAVASGPGGVSSSDSVLYRTPALPAALAGVRLEITGSAPAGYITTEVPRDSGAFTLAFDSVGRVRWYRGFAANVGELAMGTEQLPTGNFTVYVGASTGAQPVDGRYIEFQPSGETVREYRAGAPYYTDSHELLLSFAGGAAAAVQLYGYDVRPMDLRALGGRADQPVAGHVLVRQSVSGATEFLWNAWDHFSLADWVFVPAHLSSYANIDFDHPNSLALDRDGNYIVSFAGLGEITRIDAVTGQILWRLGGRHNEFSIVGDPLGGFGFQHDVRVLENGDLLFFDNGLAHVPPESRALEYRLDLKKMTATLVWEYRHDPPVFNAFVGSVQRVQNGNTLVGYGAANLITEVSSSGQRIWEGRLTVDGQGVPFFYRVRRIVSLYRYQQP